MFKLIVRTQFGIRPARKPIGTTEQVKGLLLRTEAVSPAQTIWTPRDLLHAGIDGMKIILSRQEWTQVVHLSYI